MSRTCEVPVSLDGIAAKLWCFGGSGITQRMRRSGKFYEDDLLRAIRALGLRGTYVDIGANIGNHTVWFGLACPSERLVAVEPVGLAYRLLALNCMALPKPLVLHCRAVGGSTGPTQLGGWWLRPVPDPLGVFDAVTIDRLLSQERDIALLKIDIDGQDTQALLSSPCVIERWRPVVAIEAYRRRQLGHVAEFCERHGYERRGPYCATPTYLLVPR